jgi:S1-C subfamily serine protease
VFDISTSNDIIGGNSGSPLINAKGEVIGAVFDGNIHSLGGDYGYDPKLNRAVSVSAAAVNEALRKVYGATALADELEKGA